MANVDFAYTIYIRASRDRVWAGLLEPEFTSQYWLHDNVSDWKKGSDFKHVQSGTDKVSIMGTVIDSVVHERLEITWYLPKHTNQPNEHSRVIFELADQADWPGGPWTQLKITHADLIKGGDMETSVSWGWPAVASGLKTLLETGSIAQDGSLIEGSP